MLPKNNGYLAAMLDGEGCISIATYLQKYKKNGREYRYQNTQLAVSIFQTDERLMKWLMHHYGGRYSSRPSQNERWKQGWSWCPLSSNLEKFLLMVLPYLIMKRDQALIALEFVRLGKCKTGPNNDNEQIQLKRQAIAKRCLILNKRGSPEANTSNTFVPTDVKIESDLMGDHESALVVTQAA